MHDCMNRRQTPRCENIHLAADVSDKSPISQPSRLLGGEHRLIPEQGLDTKPKYFQDGREQ